DPGPQEPCEIDGLRVRVADLEHAPRRHQPREHPWDLDDPLLRSTWSLKPCESLAAASGAEPERDGVVELADTCRLGRRRELVEEGRARERPVREHPERPRARLLVHGPAQDLPERALDELLVGARIRCERRGDARVHGATRTRRIRAPTSAPAALRRRSGAEAGRARTWGSRDPRGARP